MRAQAIKGADVHALLRDAPDEIEKVHLRQREAMHRVAEGAADRMRGRSVVDAPELVAPSRQQARRIPPRGVVGNVVDEAFHGLIDQVRVFSFALSSSDVTVLHDADVAAAN